MTSSSIGTAAKELSADVLGTFQEDNFEVQETADGYSFRPSLRLLKSSRAKRNPQTWLQFPNPPRPMLAGQEQAEEQTSPVLLESFTITL